MAERRMISKKITDTDAFLDMPLSTQCLYFHLIQNADDDGFVGNPNTICRKIGANKNDSDLLILKKFIIPFESGIVVIKHWKIHNYIQNDRYTPTTYLSEKQNLIINENKSYSIKNDVSGYILDTQYSIDKDSIEENNINNIYSPFYNEHCELLEFLNKKFNTNKKGFKEETKDIINKELENGVTLDKLKKRIDKAPLEDFDLNDALLGDDEKVFNFWNNQKIIKHTKLTTPIKMAIAKALRIYSLEEIKTYIERYNKVIKDDDYFFNYKWTLIDFLNRKDGISSFTDEGSKWISYCTKKSKPIDPRDVKIQNRSYSKEDFESVYDNLDDVII